MEKYHVAYELFENSLKLIGQKYSDANIDNNEVAVGNYWVGVGCMKIDYINTAKKYLRKFMQIKQKISTDTCDRELADIIFWYEKCILCVALIPMDYSHALNYLKRSLEIMERASHNDCSWDNDVAEALYWIGVCLKCKGKYELAIERFVEALKIQEKIPFNVLLDNFIARTDELIARTQIGIIECLIKVKRANEATVYLENIIAITQRHPTLWLESFCGWNLFKIHLKVIYRCCIMLKQPEEALFYFKQLLETEKQMPSRIICHDRIRLTKDYICKCYLEKKKYNEAAFYYTGSMIIFSKKRRQVKLVDCCRKICRSNQPLYNANKCFGFSIAIFFYLFFVLILSFLILFSFFFGITKCT